MDKFVNINIEDKNVATMPILKSTIGENVIDMRTLGKQGVWSYDPGFLSTASCNSKITYIDGDKGQLLYRGYPIEQLAEYSDYLEGAYLLLNGELPTLEQKNNLVLYINDHVLLHEQIINIFNGFNRNAHPMSILSSLVGALSSYHPEGFSFNNTEIRTSVILNLIAKMPTLTAMAYRFNQGLSFVYPNSKLSYAENFLYMMFSVENKPFTVNPIIAKAFDRILLLHADHEQNASTSAVRVAGSSGTHPYAAICAGITTLWGPAHGGANEAVLKMLNEIGSEDNVVKYVEGVKDKKYRLMGFGHRVYKNFDPRANIMRNTCHDVLDVLGKNNDNLFKIAMKLESVALSDKYFIEHKLYPNVDFYSGIILKAIGIPESMFTVIFALARTVGWLSHWQEMITDPELKISRPRQLYTGYTSRDYLKIEQR